MSSERQNEGQLVRGSSRLAAARKTRSTGLSSGRPTRRRDTASSWRSTTISSSLNSSEQSRSASENEITERPEQEQVPPGRRDGRTTLRVTTGPTDAGTELTHPTGRTVLFTLPRRGPSRRIRVGRRRPASRRGASGRRRARLELGELPDEHEGFEHFGLARRLWSVRRPSRPRQRIMDDREPKSIASASVWLIVTRDWRARVAGYVRLMSSFPLIVVEDLSTTRLVLPLERTPDPGDVVTLPHGGFVTVLHVITAARDGLAESCSPLPA